jgi:membrane fusion protein, multidrug efflux system
MAKKIILTLLALALLAGGIIGIKVLQIMDLIASGENFRPPPESVLVAEADTREWTGEFRTVGTVDALQGATLAFEVPGVVEEILFQSGGRAEAGEVLARLDSDTEKARLKAARAALELAGANLERAEGLRRTRVVAESELDAAKAETLNAAARVEELETAVAKRVLVAPFAGNLGIRLVEAGAYVQAGDPVVSLQAPDPVLVDFPLPQQYLERISTGMAVLVRAGQEDDPPLEGTLTAIDSEVDERTRNILLQATVPNPDGALRPGMFARVSLLARESARLLFIPATSVLHAAYGDSVFVVRESEEGEGLVAERKFVRLGPRQGDFVAVVEGLSEGDRVVTEGAFKLRNGSGVVVSPNPGAPISDDPRPPNQ